MDDRYARYDVLEKRDTLGWNDVTRTVIDMRMTLEVGQGVLTATQLASLRRLTQSVCPDPAKRAQTSTVAMIVRRIAEDTGDGYRHHALPRLAECWRLALDAIEAEACERHQKSFAQLDEDAADNLLHDIAKGEVRSGEWQDLPPQIVWSWRLLPDLVAAHWAQPALWSAMGFGGPASPRGYVRTSINRRDPWEAIECYEPLAGLPRHRAR